jgi:hypothetical protein
MLVCGCAHAGGDPLDDPVIQRNLRAMRAVTTIAHPDVFGMTSGLRRYAHHDFKGAMAYFKEGAYYADKLSQLCIGLMYMNGEGVSKDLVTAYAWIDLASERKYPDFVATRNSLKARLTPDQLAKAQALRVDLEKKYGDAVAKHRMELKLRLGLMNAYTGSRTGYDSGIIQVKEPGTCEPLLIIGGHALPEAGCDHGAYLSKDNWKPELYFATRDAEWKDMRGTVTVGPLTDAGAAKKDAKSTAVEAAQPKH